MLETFKFYNITGDNIVDFPFGLFILIALLICVFLNKYKNYSIFCGAVIGIYISFLFCILFFPIVIYWGNNYDFNDNIKYMIAFYNPYSRLIHQPIYSICHLIMFIPLGYIVRSKSNAIKSIAIAFIIIYGIENIQIYIDFLCGYVQYTYDTCDIFFHLISMIVGIMLYKPIKLISNIK